PGGAAVLELLAEAALDELERRLDQLLARERIANLHRGPLLVSVGQVLTGEDARSPDPVPAGRRPEQEDGVARGRGAGARDLFGGEQAHAHRVDEAVVLVALVEHRLAADRRHTDAVAVRTDPGDGTVDLPAGAPEVEPVEQRDRPRTHRHHVAQEPAHARGCSLERLDRRRMIVALDLEGDCLALAEIDDAGVLTRPPKDSRAVAREPP